MTCHAEWQGLRCALSLTAAADSAASSCSATAPPLAGPQRLLRQCACADSQSVPMPVLRRPRALAAVLRTAWPFTFMPLLALAEVQQQAEVQQAAAMNATDAAITAHKGLHLWQIWHARSLVTMTLLRHVQVSLSHAACTVLQ